jgi:hypothetical protein
MLQNIHFVSIAVMKECEIDAIFTESDLSNFTWEYSSLFSFTKLYRLEFNLEALTGDDLGLLHFRITTNGRVIGRTEVRWESKT